MEVTTKLNPYENVNGWAMLLKFLKSRVAAWVCLLVYYLRRATRLKFLRKLELDLIRYERNNLAQARMLSPPIHFSLKTVEISTKMRDGVELKAWLTLPGGGEDEEESRDAQTPKTKYPTILCRTPYDKNSFLLGRSLTRIFAERGYAAIVQDTRGRFGSAGDFFPVANEMRDGADTVAWIKKQPWSNGKVGTFGVSYLGLTAYASAGGRLVDGKLAGVDAVVPVLASSRLYPVLFHGGSTLSLDLIMRWLWLVLDVMHTNPISALFKLVTSRSQLHGALHPGRSVAIKHRDTHLLGKELQFYRQVVAAHDEAHEFWKDKDVLCDLANDPPPYLSIVAGWQDFFVAQSFRDFQNAVNSGKPGFYELTVGNWSHWEGLPPRGYGTLAFKRALEVFDETLKGGDSDGRGEGVRQRVNVFVVHSECEAFPNGKWLSFPSWPPSPSIAATKPMVLHLLSGGRLGEVADLKSILSGNGLGGATYSESVFDPEDPTPHVGGPSFNWANGGRALQNELEARHDVLTFSTEPLTESVTVAGNVTLRLRVWSDNPHTDVFVKLCDVDPAGRSFNLCERMTRLSPAKYAWDAQGFLELDVEVGPVCAEFRRGHRVRLQVSGGAHPNYLRHHGTEHSLEEEHEELRKATKRVFHGASRVMLPLVKV